MIEKYSLCLNEFRKNLAANLDRSPLIHSYCYASAGDRPTLFAIFLLILSTWMWCMQVMQEHLLARPFMQHTG